MKVLNTSETCPMTDCTRREECEFFAKRQGIKFNADALPGWCASYTKEAKPIKKELIKKLAEKCWVELGYYDVVNERTEEVDYELIVECVLRHWSMEVLRCFGQ